MPGWSNFCTLAGHFSKLFEFAGRNRLKPPTFVPKSGCSLKKKGLHLESVSEILIFVPKSGCSLKKKKGLHLESVSEILIFVPKSGCSLKKKKGLHLESVSEIPIFVPKSGCSLKKKRSSLGIGLRNSYFRSKIRVFSKKEKVFTWNRSPKYLFSFQNQGVL